MAHSAEEFAGERVEKFVMSVIEAVSTSSGSGGGGGGRGSSRSRNKSGNVSRYPKPPSFTSPTMSKSQSSQELVEDALGSLATLLSVSSSRVFVHGANGGIRAVTRSNGKLQIATGRKDNPPRKNVLRRKKSSLKALSPEDLGRVSKSPLQSDGLSPSPPSVVVTYPSSSSASSPNEKFFNDKGEKITASSPKTDDHPSIFHLRKPISSYTTNGITHNGNNNDSNNKQESEIKIGIANNRTSGGGSASSSTFKEITEKVVGQRSPNYTDSKDDPEPLLLLHNNDHSNNTSIAGVTSSPKDDESHQNSNKNTNHQNSGNNDQTSATDLHAQVEKNCYADDDDDKERRQELDNHDDGRHGHMCVHHYHHHSHHHHYHYYENGGQQISHRGHRHHHNHLSFSTNNNNQHVGDDDQHNHDQQQQQLRNDTVGENINGSAGLIQHQQLHDLHNHQHAKMIKSDVYSSSPAEQPPKSPPPSHDHLDDISFYRKFSATSPPPSFANRHRRSKSSLEWAANETELNVLISTRGGGRLCSKSKRQKSRSTPVRLDIIGYDSKKSPQRASPSPPPAVLPDGSEFYGYGCKCGGCLYCCNEISCNCCCDECCCARQCGHVSASLGNVATGTDIIQIQKSGNSRKGHTSAQHEKATSGILKQRSRSMNSVLSYNNKDADMDDDVDVNDPDSFIDAHLLRHLELYDSDFGDDDDDDDDDDEDDEKNKDDLNMSINKSGHNSERETDDTGQVQLISIKRKGAGASEHDHQEASKVDCENGTTTSLVVVGNIRGGSGSSTTAAELISPRRSTNIILVRKAPTRSSVHRSRDGTRRNSTGNDDGTSPRRSTNTSVLRTANGEIRSSSIVPLAGNSNETSGGGAFVVEEQARRSAVMTVTVDSMSLFLDAVHLQMNQG